MPDPDSARFLRFLRDHYLEKDNVGEIARKMGVSVRNVQAAFQKCLGRSMLDELIRLRIEHSKKLLENTKMKIEEVGAASGFSNRFHFIRAFQRVTGETPKEYRRKLPKL